MSLESGTPLGPHEIVAAIAFGLLSRAVGASSNDTETRERDRRLVMKLASALCLIANLFVTTASWACNISTTPRAPTQQTESPPLSLPPDPRRMDPSGPT